MFFRNVRLEFDKLVEFLTYHEIMVHNKQLLKLAMHNAQCSKKSERDKWLYWARAYRKNIDINRNKRDQVYLFNRKKERRLQKTKSFLYNT